MSSFENAAKFFTLFKALEQQHPALAERLMKAVQGVARQEHGALHMLRGVISDLPPDDMFSLIVGWVYRDAIPLMEWACTPDAAVKDVEALLARSGHVFKERCDDDFYFPSLVIQGADDPEKLEVFVNTFPELLEWVNRDGTTALGVAAREGRTKCLQVLLARTPREELARVPALMSALLAHDQESATLILKTEQAWRPAINTECRVVPTEKPFSALAYICAIGPVWKDFRWLAEVLVGQGEQVVAVDNAVRRCVDMKHLDGFKFVTMQRLACLRNALLQATEGGWAPAVSFLLDTWPAELDPNAREARPGDIFNIHASFIEKAASYGPKHNAVTAALLGHPRCTVPEPREIKYYVHSTTRGIYGFCRDEYEHIHGEVEPYMVALYWKLLKHGRKRVRATEFLKFTPHTPDFLRTMVVSGWTPDIHAIVPLELRKVVHTMMGVVQRLEKKGVLPLPLEMWWLVFGFVNVYGRYVK
jgi:hypothetical protein